MPFHFVKQGILTGEGALHQFIGFGPFGKTFLEFMNL